MPYFQLTHESPEDLKFSNYSELFTSKYDEWIDVATKIYREMNEKLGEQWDNYIIDHKTLQENVVRIVYDDGTRVFINYGDDPVKAEGYSIKAMDYTVVDKEGRAK